VATLGSKLGGQTPQGTSQESTPTEKKKIGLVHLLRNLLEAVRMKSRATSPHWQSSIIEDLNTLDLTYLDHFWVFRLNWDSK
jgi:hypothetical protein